VSLSHFDLGEPVLPCHHKILQLQYEVAWNGNPPDLFHEGGLTVADAGIFRDKEKGKGLRVADFSYHPNDSLAQLVVEAWVDKDFRELLLAREKGKVTADAARYAKASLAGRGLYLQHPVVITEDEYNRGYHMQDPTEVVFVLPDQPRVAMTPPPGQSLLETARLLMACTPHGI
jgi:hypothetical protein